ncbi:hypothetical protein, conserved [Eimeria praecox]|uniref:Uncharacterized protein n=1 Tax=Eimeria praecox TaxID=51316 RepID=U6G3L9_9EIME|nr:hypothetical protein, conserved [Eimeria praecox]
MEDNAIPEDAALRQQPQQQQQQQQIVSGPDPNAEAWQLELYYLLESIEACQQQLVLLSEAHAAAALSAAAPSGGDEEATRPAATPSLRDSRTQEFAINCIMLLCTDTASPAQRPQAEMSLMAFQGSPGYLTLLLQCYLRCTATAAAAAAVAAKGAAAAADQLVQLTGKLQPPVPHDPEAPFAALVLLKGALQSRSSARGSDPADEALRGELAFVQAMLVCLYKIVGAPRCPRMLKVYVVLLRRLARGAATTAATAPTAARLQQVLSQEAVQQTLNSYNSCSSSWGSVLPLGCGTQPLQLQQTVTEVTATEGALLLLLLEATIVRLLRSAQRDDADTALYAYILKQILKELVTVRIGGGQLFFATCRALLPFLSQLVAALSGRLLPLVRANVQLLGEQQQLQQRLDEQLGHSRARDQQQPAQQPQQQQQQEQQEVQWLQEQIERMQREILAHSETWEDMTTMLAHMSSALLLCEARAGRVSQDVGDLTALRGLHELLLLLLQQQQLSESGVPCSTRAAFKLFKGLLRGKRQQTQQSDCRNSSSFSAISCTDAGAGFAEVADRQPWAFAKMGQGSMSKLLVAAVQQNKVFSRGRAGEPETDSPLISLPLELIASAVRGSMSFLLDIGNGQAGEVEGPRAASAGTTAASEREEARLLRTQVSEDLRSFFVSVGGLHSLMQDIAPAVFRANVTEKAWDRYRPSQFPGADLHLQHQQKCPQQQQRRTSWDYTSVEGRQAMLLQRCVHGCASFFASLAAVSSYSWISGCLCPGCVQSLDFLSRPEELYGGLGCVEEGTRPLRDAAVALLEDWLAQGLLGPAFLLRTFFAASASLEKLAASPAAAAANPAAVASAAASAPADASTTYLAQVQEADGLLALLAASLQGAIRAGIFETDQQEHQQGQRRPLEQRRQVSVQVLGAEGAAAYDSAVTQQQLQQLLQQFTQLSRLLRWLITTGPFAAAVAAAAANKDQEAAAALAIVAARCCAVLKLLLQIHSVVPPADFREALSGLVEDLLISQPLMKVLVSRHTALQQQKLLLQQQHQQLQLEQVLVQLQETEALVETALRAPLFEAVTNCVQVGALSVAKAMINRSTEQEELLEQGQGQQGQQEQLNLPYRELQRPFLLLLAQSNRSLWSSRLLKMLLLLQSCGREEQQEQPLQDAFFDFSDLPNYGDVTYLRRVILQSGSSNSSSSGGGELRWSQVYEQLLRQFKAYSNNEGLQLQLLTFLHGALLIGRPEVSLHLPPGMLPVPTLPMGLLTAAFQAFGWAVGAGPNPDVPTEPSGALQRCGFRMVAGVLRAADPLRHSQDEVVLLLQLVPAIANVHLKVAEPQRPLLLLCLLEAAALCIAVGAAPLAPPQIRQMAGSLLPVLYSSVEARLVQSPCLGKVVQQQLKACAMLVLQLLLLDRGDWPLLEKLLQQALAATASRALLNIEGEGAQAICGSFPVLCCWGLRYPLAFVAAAAAALAATAAGVRQELMGPFMLAAEEMQTNELLLRFATAMLTTKRCDNLKGLPVSVFLSGLSCACIGVTVYICK